MGKGEESGQPWGCWGRGCGQAAYLLGMGENMLSPDLQDRATLSQGPKALT